MMVPVLLFVLMYVLTYLQALYMLNLFTICVSGVYRNAIVYICKGICFCTQI